ncbi:MAG TPA: RnfABCDGE type electron transport complex subunit D [Woeseiaceae bacterium]|nr:RnfABCDGE type electron transport complex subunit D [Woeseiaceae bacterium]
MALWTPLLQRYGPRFGLLPPLAATRVTTRAPYVRDAMSVPAALLLVVVATLPAWAVGLWFTGTQIISAAGPELAAVIGPWRAAFVAAVPQAALPAAVGLAYFLPLLFVALAAGLVWETLFARLRRRPVDCGIFHTAWLLVLLLPAGASPGTVAVGASFAFVVGKLLFGGTGRYLVSPALLGLVFLHFAYPGTPEPALAFPVAGAQPETALDVALAGGTEALAAAGHSLMAVAAGNDIGAFGTTSALACALGAVLLMLGGLVSWRIVVAALVGSLAMTLALNAWGPEDPAFDLPWRWHLVTGGFAFLIAFIATDPVGASVTRPGRWIYGLVIGAAAILFRVANSSHPEGTIYAVLLISLAAPAIDHAVIAWQMRRHRRRLAS